MLIDADWCWLLLIDTNWSSNKVHPGFLLSEHTSGASPVIFHVNGRGHGKVSYSWSGQFYVHVHCPKRLKWNGVCLWLCTVPRTVWRLVDIGPVTGRQLLSKADKNICNRAQTLVILRTRQVDISSPQNRVDTTANEEESSFYKCALCCFGGIADLDVIYTQVKYTLGTPFCTSWKIKSWLCWLHSWISNILTPTWPMDWAKSMFCIYFARWGLHCIWLSVYTKSTALCWHSFCTMGWRTLNIFAQVNWLYKCTAKAFCTCLHWGQVLTVVASTQHSAHLILIHEFIFLEFSDQYLLFLRFVCIFF